MLGSLRLYLALAVAIAFAGAVGFGVLFHAKWKAAEAEKLRLEQQVQVQQATIQQHQQNVTAMHNSVTIQQNIAQQSAPIHQAIEDSTPETALNEKQKTIADCILALFRGVFKGGTCSRPERSVVPSTRETGSDRAKDG